MSGNTRNMFRMFAHRFLDIGIVAFLALALAGQVASAAALVIRNDLIEVKCDPADGQLSIGNLVDQRVFATGKLVAGGGNGRVVGISDKTLGQGQAIEIAHAGGGIDRIMLYPELPFSLFRSTLHNGGSEPTITNKVKTVELTLDLKADAASLRMLGTGGLGSTEKLAGSYMWLAVADPKTRHGVVGGWITTDRGSGIVFADSADNKARMQAQVEYGRLRIKPNESADLETFVVGYFDDARVGLETWADTLARVYNIHLPPQPVGYCTWYHAGAWNEKALAQQAEFAGKNLRPFGFSVLQIDDGWQDGQTKNGPRKNFTRVRADGPYASGMKEMADKIKAQDLVPGIWFMPFSGSYEDPWFKDHPDWFVKHDDGTPHESRWGGTAMDMTSPGAQEYLRGEVNRLVHEWGYRYLKMDGLTSGAGVQHVYVNDAYKEDGMGDGVFHDPEKTNIEALRDGLRLIRAAAGPETYLLGCTVAQNMRAYGGGMGLVDAMRVGPDNNWQWKSLITGPRYGTRNYHLHGRIWHNDPDCVYARAQMPLSHAQVIASWATLSGQLSISSEDFARLPAERLDLLKRTMPAHGLPTRPVDLFDEALPRMWLVTDARSTPRRDVVGLFNWGDAEAAFDYSLDWIGLGGNGQYVGFDFWGNKLIAPFKDRLQQRVPGQSCMVLAVRGLADHPQVISTSRHITGGMVDLSDEKWNSETRELSGTSKVVGGDSYELRVVLQSTKGIWRVDKVAMDGDGADPGQIANTEDHLLRVTVKSAQSRDVRWTIRFEVPAEAQNGDTGAR
jgi:hypothetical protein